MLHFKFKGASLLLKGEENWYQGPLLVKADDSPPPGPLRWGPGGLGTLGSRGFHFC